MPTTSAPPAAADATDWRQVVALYDQLHAFQPNEVVGINRAVAVAALHGPAAGLAALDALDADRVDSYQPYHAARAGLLTEVGRAADAVQAFDRAIALTTNPVERRFLTDQRDRVASRR